MVSEGANLRRAGMREVARLAGVSVSTVANVLNQPAIVATGTRRRVEEAMATVGYVRSGPARQLRGLPSIIVGSVTLDLANPFYAELNRGIEDRLAEAGCLLLACSTDVRAGKEKQILSMLEEQAVRGIIIAPVDADLQQLIGISQRGTPVVLLDHPREGIALCAVSVDNVLGGRLAAEHLIALGHRRIAFLRGPLLARPVAERLGGVRQALSGAGLDPAEALLDVEAPARAPFVQAARAAVEQIIGDSDPPTAVICINDTTALGALQGLGDAGLRVPRDISVVGCDDMPFAAQLAPPLTTIALPKYQLGYDAADLLLDETTAGPSRSGHVHREVRFSPTLVVRGSTAPHGGTRRRHARSPEPR